MKRRVFISTMLGGMSILASGLWGWVKALTPKKFRRADVIKTYPGKIKSIDKSEIQKISPWSG